MKGNKHEQMAYLVWFYCIVAVVAVMIVGSIVRN